MPALSPGSLPRGDVGQPETGKTGHERRLRFRAQRIAIRRHHRVGCLRCPRGWLEEYDLRIT
jgi:hypothetical protein